MWVFLQHFFCTRGWFYSFFSTTTNCSALDFCSFKNSLCTCLPKKQRGPWGQETWQIKINTLYFDDFYCTSSYNLIELCKKHENITCAFFRRHGRLVIKLVGHFIKKYYTVWVVGNCNDFKKKIYIYTEYILYIYKYTYIYIYIYSSFHKYWNSRDKIALLAVESRHLQIWLKIYMRQNYRMSHFIISRLNTYMFYQLKRTGLLESIPLIDVSTSIGTVEHKADIKY